MNRSVPMGSRNKVVIAVRAASTIAPSLKKTIRPTLSRTVRDDEVPKVRERDGFLSSQIFHWKTCISLCCMRSRGEGETMNRIRCFSEDCVNFRKAGWIFGGECGSSEIVVSSGTGACLTKVPCSEVEKVGGEKR